MSFSIWCFLVGHPHANIFLVDIDLTKTGDDLKDKIKEETTPTLNAVPAFHLTLDRVAIDKTLEGKASITELERLSKNSQECTRLDDREVLSGILMKSPLKVRNTLSGTGSRG